MPVLFKIKRRPCKMAFFLCMRILLSPDKMDCAPWVPLTVYWHIQTIYYPSYPHISSRMRPGNSYRHKNPVPHFSYLPFTLQFNQQQFQTWDWKPRLLQNFFLSHHTAGTAKTIHPLFIRLKHICMTGLWYFCYFPVIFLQYFHRTCYTYSSLSQKPICPLTQGGEDAARNSEYITSFF